MANALPARDNYKPSASFEIAKEVSAGRVTMPTTKVQLVFPIYCMPIKISSRRFNWQIQDGNVLYGLGTFGYLTKGSCDHGISQGRCHRRIAWWYAISLS